MESEQRHLDLIERLKKIIAEQEVDIVIQDWQISDIRRKLNEAETELKNLKGVKNGRQVSNNN